MKKTWRYPLPVHRFRGILRSLILIFHFRFPLNVSGAQERERLEIKSIASTVCSFRSPDTHTHTPMQTFVKLGRFYTLGSDGQIMWPLSFSTYCKKSNHLVAIDCFHLKTALMGCNKGQRCHQDFILLDMHLLCTCHWLALGIDTLANQGNMPGNTGG